MQTVKNPQRRIHEYVFLVSLKTASNSVQRARCSSTLLSRNHYAETAVSHPSLYNRTTVLILFSVTLALLRESGNLGLSAFLPSPSKTMPSLAGKVAGMEESIPHLPLVPHWEDGAFALRDVIEPSTTMTVREWSLQLLQRYRFVIGA